MENSVGAAAAIAPLLLRNLITSIFIYADKLAGKYKLLEVFRHLIVSSFLFFLQILPSFFPSLNFSRDVYYYPRKPSKSDNFGPVSSAAAGDSAIGRALSQLLSIVSDIPVSSRKYEVVRSLAEKVIDDNLREGFESLREVNRTVLSAAFERTLARLEAAVLEEQRGEGSGYGLGFGPANQQLGRVFVRAVKCIVDMGWTRVVTSGGEEAIRLGSSAEKLAAELLWVAEKLAACGYAKEAVCQWASASNLAWLALSAQPRLQGSLVKVSAFLFKQAKDIGREDEADDSNKKVQKETNIKMLMSWLPLLCRASNGTDAPILTGIERAELERVLEETIDMLEEEDEQEKVLSLWLHHFTYCPSSDWPNLHACYSRWCTASRKLLLLH